MTIGMYAYKCKNHQYRVATIDRDGNINTTDKIFAELDYALEHIRRCGFRAAYLEA